MTVEIHFRGPMLYVLTNGAKELKEIVMPRVRSGGKHVKPHGGESGKHADFEKARPHFSGLLYSKGGGAAHFEELDGDVTIEELLPNGKPASGGCSVDATFVDRLPLLNRIVNDPAHTSRHFARLTAEADGTSKFWKRAAARFELRSGTVDIGKLSDDECHFAEGCTFEPKYETNQKFVLDARWRPSDGGSTVRIRCPREGGSPLDLELSAGMEVYFYTYDTSRPSKTVLLDEKEPPPVGLVDVDFKWVYQVLKAPDDDIRKWTREHKCNKLPAPEFDKAWIKAAPTVSTCYTAAWEE